MAFPDIDVTKPVGTYRVSTIDDYERETRRWLRSCMMEISGYPDSSAVKIQTWTTANRPGNPTAGVFGFNTTTGFFEYFNGSTWKSLETTLPDIYEKAKRDQKGNIIDETYATKAQFNALQDTVNGAISDFNEAIDGINITKLKIW